MRADLRLENDLQRQLNRPRTSQTVERIIAPSRGRITGTEARIQHAAGNTTARERNIILGRREIRVIENIETVGFEPKPETIAYSELPIYSQFKLLKRKSPQGITAEGPLDIDPSGRSDTRWSAKCPNHAAR
jgi:hypothetical protein